MTSPDDPVTESDDAAAQAAADALARARKGTHYREAVRKSAERSSLPPPRPPVA